MSQNKRQANQILSANTQLHYQRKCEMIAKNVFLLEDFPKNIDIDYVNRVLYQNGCIAFFYDDVLNEVKAMPFTTCGPLDDQGNPLAIRVHAINGDYNRLLKKGEYVIMWDNTERRSIVMDVLMFAERLAKYTRTVDINISQQRTPRAWSVQDGKEESVRRVLREVDSYEDSVLTYSALNVDDINCILAPAPFVADKVNTEKDKLWAEFLGFVGVSNLSVEKKERQIRDEVVALQGGTIASRFSRFEPRKNAIDKINDMFNLNCSVSYYDGEPDMQEEDINNLEEESESEE